MPQLIVTTGEVNQINRGEPDASHNDADSVIVGKGSGANMYRSFWRFSLGELPARRTIHSAQLILNQFLPSPLGGQCHLRNAAKPWVAYGPDSPCTWNHYDSGKPWKTAGGDFWNSPIASATLSTGSLPFPNPIEFDVASLLAASFSELSMIMMVDDEEGDLSAFTHFHSLDLLPTLTIDYTEVSADILTSGVSWLSEKRHAKMTKPIVYVYNGLAISILATPGRSEWEERDDYGNVIHQVKARDYLVRSADLPVEPSNGHVIVDDGYVYEVASPGGSTSWQWSDQNKLTYRIHTKQVGTV